MSEKPTTPKPAEAKKSLYATVMGGIKGFTGKKQQQTDALKVTAAGSQVDLVSQGRLYDPFAWVKHILLWTNLQIVILAVACAIITVLSHMVRNRDLMVIDLTPSLREAGYKQFHQRTTDRDEFDRFVIGVLSLMNQFDYRNQPNVELLKGLVNPDIYMSVQSRYVQNAETIKSKGIIHELHITQIENVYPSVNGKRFSCTVKGYLNINTFVNDRKEARFIPYRARVVVRLQPESQINRTSFYLLQLAEYAGDDAARRFDAEIKKELETKGLK